MRSEAHEGTGPRMRGRSDDQVARDQADARPLTQLLVAIGTCLAATLLAGNVAAQTIDTLYFSTLGNDAVPGVASPYDDSDLYSFETGNYGRARRAVAELGIPAGANVDALSWDGSGAIYVSFSNASVTISGLGTVLDEQVIKRENGAWSYFFNGATCGLNVHGDGDVDAIALVGNVLYFSTLGPIAVSGLANPDDADVYAWAPGSSSCTRLFDGSAVGLQTAADIDGLEVRGTTLSMSFDRDGGTTVPGGVGVVQDETVVSYDTSSRLWATYFAGPGLNVTTGQDVDAISIATRTVPPPAPLLSITAPTAGATVVGSTITIRYTTSGDTTGVSYASFSLDGGPEMRVPAPQGEFQVGDVALGTHVLTGFLARADNTKIAGSDATAVTFTVSAPPPPPRLVITSPLAGTTLTSSTVSVAFTSTGDLTEANHARFRLDGGADMPVMSLSGQFQIDAVTNGAHVLDGYLVRADQTSIQGSDAVPVSFSVSATPPPPRLTLSAPADGSTIVGSTVDVSFASSGDLSQADHVHLRLDGGPDIMVMSLNGQVQLTGVAPGSHYLDGYLVRADHSRIEGSDATRITFTAVDASGNDPARIGQWSAPINIPTVAVNLALLRTGKAILWAGDFATAPNYGELWDPATNQITPAPNPFSNIFCSAHVALPDGRLLVAGGHDAQNGVLGIRDANTFDPVSETWSSRPDMTYRRWYPTLTSLADGRAIITSGSENSETTFVEVPEVYDPVTNTWTSLDAARLSVPQYPMMFLLPDGRLLQAGSTEFPTATRALEIAAQRWSVVDSRVLDGGSGVMYLPGKILKSGSASQDGQTPTAQSANTTYVLDMTAASPAWRTIVPMNFARTFHNLTSLADGTVLVTSGSQRKSETNLAPAVLEAELWSPDTETWTTLAPMQTPRIYHSTAILLPDGRVAVSGSGNIAGATDQKTLEIFSPPYLFKGARPVVTSAPTRIEYGSTFTIQTPDAANIRAVNLLRPGAATHNFDQDQRFVPLTFTRSSGSLQVQASSNPNVAPPGYYMLFLVSNAGVPSVARFVRFPAPYEDSTPPSVPTDLSAAGSIGRATLNWTAATDAGGILEYEIHRSTTPGFAPSAATLLGRTSQTSYTDSGLSAGTYHYVVVAVDSAGNRSAASAQVSLTVQGDTLAPTVAVTAPLTGATIGGFVTMSATAADDVGVTGVQFRVDGVPVGAEDTSSPYGITWNSTSVANGSHTITAVARDASGNSATSAAITVLVSNSAQQPSGLVAYYGFDEGSGTSVTDGSGSGNGGTISGATWTPIGRYGSALSFDGSNDIVSVPDAASLDLTTALTLEAWVYPTALSGWRTVLQKDVPGELSYSLYAHDNVPRPAGYVRVGTASQSVAGAAALPLNAWTHLAFTYDGATLRLYQNGEQVGSRALTGAITTSSLPLTIGGNAAWGEHFAGRIDEVRLYNRALTAAEIAADMAGPTPVGPRLGFASPASGASVSGTTVTVNYSTSGSTVDAAQVRVQLDGGPDLVSTALTGSLQITSVQPGSHVLTGYVARADGTKIDGSDAPSVSFTTTVPDTTAPVVVVTAPRDGDTVGGTVAVTANASDNIAVAGVQFRLDGTPLGAEDTAAPYSVSWNTATTPNAAHTLTAVARDAAGNASTSIAVRVVVSNTVQQPAGLVAAYGFEDGSGGAAADTSGGGNNGVISGATWTSSGRQGRALSFDGAGDVVTVPDANALDLTTGMTLEAWVYPTALSGWRTVVLKEVPGELAYALYAHDDVPRPAGYVRIGSGSQSVAGTAALPLNTWTHLAVTYDGAALRLYQNGSQAGSRALTGSIATSTLPLQIGGNALWGEWFAGRIDEVKIYNRALSAAELQTSMNVPVVPPPPAQPTRSSTIAVATSARRVWSINPDNDTVTVLNADTSAVVAEVAVGKRPTSVAIDGAGQAWVTCRGDDTIWVLDATTGSVRRTLPAPRGSAPVAVVFEPAGANGYVSFEGTGQVRRVATGSTTLGASLQVGPAPRALAINAAGTRLYVSQFISTGGSGTVHSIDLATFAQATAIVLPADTTSIDGSLAARGVPNYVASIAVHPSGDRAWVAAKKDNLVRGLFRDGLPLTFETTVRALVARLDLTTGQERTAERIDVDNHSQPSAVLLSPSGQHAFVTMQGNNRLLVLNPLGVEVVRADTGLAPQGVALDPSTNRLYTQDLLSRTVSVFDATQLLTLGVASLPRIAQVSTVATERLAAAVLQGKRLFYNAEDPRMGRDGYLSCASCHLDGDTDGQVWDFTDRGEGLRNTAALRGQGGVATAPLHWTGNFDEVQDFENDIRSFFGGLGFMSDADFNAGTRGQPLGDPKAGLSLDLDALAAYVNSLSESGRSPYRQSDGSLTPGAQLGQQLFVEAGCQACHSGTRLTDSPSGVRHDVGTIKPGSGKRIGGTLDGLDTPTLVGLWASAPYLHDGSAATVRDVLTTANAAGQHGNLSGLTPAQIDQLVEYLLQLETVAP